jgi:predicted NBD/HSP70 family sugar kinase
MRLRRQHERIIFWAISANLTISRTQLAELTGLSGQSVGRVARTLLDAGLIEETGMARPKGPGASPVGLRVRAEGAFSLGFGLERDYLSGVALDLGGNIRWQISRHLAEGETAENTLRLLEQDVRNLLKTPEWSARRDRLCGVGLAAPGPVDVTTGTILGPPNFPSWEHVDVAKELGQAFDLPVLIDNAATAAAIGTAWRLPPGYRPYLYCYWGLGIGGGLVIGDDVYRGATGNAIEIGHVGVDPDGRPCECGNVGCLETVASVRAVLRDAAPYGPFLTLAEVMAAARTTPEVAAVVTRAAEKMATALVSVLNVADVDEIVLGGEHLEQVEEVFLPVIRDRIEHRAFRRRIAPTKVSVSDIGEIASATGAAALVFRSLLPDALPSPATRERGRQQAWAPLR